MRLPEPPEDDGKPIRDEHVDNLPAPLQNDQPGTVLGLTSPCALVTSPDSHNGKDLSEPLSFRPSDRDSRLRRIGKLREKTYSVDKSVGTFDRIEGIRNISPPKTPSNTCRRS